MSKLSELLFNSTGPMSFRRKAIPPKVRSQILGAATSAAWLGRWRMLIVANASRRTKVVEAWQRGLRRLGRTKDVKFVERWKMAPLFVVFCQPKALQDFGWVPAEYARIYSIHEVGTAVRSIELMALEHGIGLHSIMGLLHPEVGNEVKSVLKIPESQELVFFGILGYPDEIAEQKFPKLDAVSYFENWGNTVETRRGA